MAPISLEAFLNLPTDDLAKLVRGDEAKTCVFPFNGTRRWFLLEHGRNFDTKEAAKKYIEATTQAYINTYKLVFEHGIDHIVAPAFGGELLTNRGEEYMRQIGVSLSLLAVHPDFVNFYKEYDVRVHFYGDYRKQFKDTSYAYIIDQFDEITRQTATHASRALFYGVFAEDATYTTAELAIQHFQQTGSHPTRRDLIERYYGEFIEKADIFIGYEKFNVFDYPMLAWGEESLYFTVAPSLYMNESQLRHILYDFLYLRPVQDPDYFSMPKADFESMRRYYEANHEVTFGTGEIRGGIWYATSPIKK